MKERNKVSKNSYVVQLLDILLQFQDDKLQQLSHICTKEASCLTMWKECLTKNVTLYEKL